MKDVQAIGGLIAGLLKILIGLFVGLIVGTGVLIWYASAIVSSVDQQSARLEKIEQQLGRLNQRADHDDIDSRRSGRGTRG